MAITLLIRNARVIDGTGQPAWVADVAVDNDRITAIGTLPSQVMETAAMVFDARGLTLTPGLIDPHSHADLILPLPASEQAELLRGKITQGITTTIIGNCGLGCAPVISDEAENTLRAVNAWMTPRQTPWKWRSFGEYLDVLAENGLPLNIAALVPHGPIRISVMGLRSGAPARAELRQMRALTAASLKAGALGMSTGLIYPPGMFSDTAELSALARVVADHDGIYTSHIRGSSETLIPAARELLQIGMETGARVHHSHNEAVGRAHWPKIDRVLKMQTEAADDGVRISFDMFPYTAAATMMIAIYPPWALEDGVDQLLERLQNQNARRKIRRDIERRASSPRPGGWPHNLVRATGWEAIHIGYVESRKNKRYENRSLAELGALTGKHPFDAISDLLLEENAQVSMLIYEVTGERDTHELLAKYARHHLCAFCTDAEDYGRGRPHPAAYGAFPRILSQFTRPQDTGLTIEEAVRKMTSYPAQLFGLRDRGVIRPGAFADLVLLDPARIRDHASFRNPRRIASGIHQVYVNGSLVYGAPHLRQSTAGRLIRH